MQGMLLEKVTPLALADSGIQTWRSLRVTTARSERLCKEAMLLELCSHSRSST